MSGAGGRTTLRIAHGARVAWQICAALPLALCGCSGDDDTHASPGASDAATPVRDAATPAHDAATASDAAALPAALFGGFTVKFVAAAPATATRAAKPAYSSILGKLLERENPSAIVWEVADEAQGCQLLTPRVPFCDPLCGTGAICVEDGECVDSPTSQDLGPVHVSGLGLLPFSMKVSAGNYQYPQSSQWPYPPCDEGDEIRVQGIDPLQGLDFNAACVAPLAFPGPVAIETGKPLALAWSAPGQTDLGRIRIKLNISHHGGERGSIECEVADTGSFAIPAQLVAQLVDLGVAGFPTIVLSRVTEGPGDTSQTKTATLLVSAGIERPVEIPGLTSCSEDSDCEAGQVCADDASCM